MGTCVLKAQKRRRKKGKTFIKITAFLLVLGFAAFAYLHWNVHPIVRRISEEEVRALATTAVNRAAVDLMTDTFDYNDILTVEKNTAGDISMIRAKPVELNALARNMTLLTQSYLSQMGYQGISIPLGTLSGLAFLSGRGSEVHFKTLPVGTANTRYISSFKSMGINQTRHQIYMDVSADVNVIIPGMSFSFTTVTQLPIAENIIVGKVPDTYLQSSSLDEMLNLIP